MELEEIILFLLGIFIFLGLIGKVVYSVFFLEPKEMGKWKTEYERAKIGDKYLIYDTNYVGKKTIVFLRYKDNLSLIFGHFEDSDIGNVHVINFDNKEYIIAKL